MPARRREELLEAGVSLALAQRFQDWLASVDTRSITDAVGVTTGSFFHHFRNRAEYAAAVAERFQAQWEARVAHLLEQANRASDDPTLQRAAARAEWAALVRPSEAVALQHLLWIARDRAVGDDASVTSGDVLRGAYRDLSDAAVPVYERGNEAVGREMMPPFSVPDLAVLINALAEGLQMRATVDPGAVRDDLYVDGVSALYIAITRPRAERAELADDLSSLNARLIVRSPAPGAPAADEPSSWRAIADAAAHLFTDRSPSDVRLTEVAEAAGVSTSTVRNQLGSVSGVAAAGFARFVPELTEIAARPLTPEEGPVVRIEQVLVRYLELLQEHRGIAEALVTEVARATGPAARERSRDVRAIVGVTDLLVDLTRELRARGMLRRRIETERLARTLVQVATIQALTYRDDPVERIVDDVLTLVLDGALAIAAGP